MTARIQTTPANVQTFGATPGSQNRPLSAAELHQMRQTLLAGGCFPQRPRPQDAFDPCNPRPYHGGCWRPRDLSAMQETNKLDRTPGKIGAEQLAEAIKNGTADLDGNAAGSEFRTFADWAHRNMERLTPEAREVMGIYSRYAAQSQFRGESGIPQGEWNKMVAEMKDVGDRGVKGALGRLDRMPSPISGEDFAKAIRQGVGDKDGQTATEAQAIRDWAQKNSDKLSPEAKEVLGIFNKHVAHASAAGHKDLPAGEWREMLREFRNVGDVSARKATEKLDRENGPISGEDMLAAIKEGTADKDGHSTTSELREFQKWARANPERLTPEARKVLQTYEKHAQRAGPEGMTDAEFKAMTKEAGQFKTFRDSSMRDALEKLDDKSGKISAKDLTQAIKTGAGDHDGQAAGVEFADMMKWARQNYDRLSPDARKVLDIYEKYATRSMAGGSTGISTGNFDRMLKEMSRVGQPVLRPMHIVA